MASPFSMLSMLRRARMRVSAQPAETTTSVSDETSSTATLATSSTTSATATLSANQSSTSVSTATATAAPAPKDTSDTASIRSTTMPPTMRRGTLLSRMSSGVVPPSVTTETAVTTVTAGPTSTTITAEPASISESPKVLPVELKSSSSGDLPAAAAAAGTASRTSTDSAVSSSSSTDGERTDGEMPPRTESPITSDDDAGPIAAFRAAAATPAVDDVAAKQKAQIDELEAVVAKQKEQLAQLQEVSWKQKEQLAQLEAVSAKQKERLLHLASEKTALEAEKVKLVEGFKETEGRLEAERAEEKTRFEEEQAILISNLREKTEQWAAERRERQEEKARWVAEMEAKTKKWAEEREEETRRRDEALALVERDNEDLTLRVAELEELLENEGLAKKDVEEKLSQVQEEKDTALEDARLLQLSVDSATEEIVKLRHDELVQQQRYASLLDEMAMVREERDAEIAARDALIQSLTATLNTAKKEIEAIRDAAEAKEREKDESIGELKDQMSAYYNYVEETDRRNRLLSDQLKRQSMDLHFAKPSESRHLLQSAAEPVDAALRILSHFNNEVFQAAATFADYIDNDTTLDTSQLEDLEAVIVKLAPIMSRDLVIALRNAYTDPNQEPDTLLLQVAFQACMTYCANRFINSWYPFQWEHGDLLQILYGRILDAGKKEAAESWRATTKALLRLTSESHPQLVAYLRDTVYDLLAAVGRPKSQEAVEVLVKEYEDRFSVIARLAIRLHILFSDYLSNDAPSNLGCYVGPPGAEFLHKHLEDCYPVGDREGETDFLADNRVLCTAELGLQTIQDTTRSGLILLKPKVVLSSILNPGW